MRAHTEYYFLSGTVSHIISLISAQKVQQDVSPVSCMTT